MDAALYPQMAAVEDTHWWFAGRRAICERMLDRIGLPSDAVILELGCGTGGNFPMLARRGQLYAMDADESALGFAASRRLAKLARGSLPGEFPFAANRFDLVVMTDVLEHLDERGSLCMVRSSLRPRGWLLMTVPALGWLWSEHDATHHHRRRYRAIELRRLLGDCGFAIDYLSYYNFLLFPAIAGVRLFQRLSAAAPNRANRKHDLTMPSRFVNAVLLRLFSCERFVLGPFRPPIGVSLIAVAHV